MRLAVYTDYLYRGQGDVVYGERAFVVFQCELRASVDRLVITGRLSPVPGTSHYRVPADVDFVGLPHYETLARPHEAVVAMVRSLRHFWRALDDVDTVWLLGPYIHALAYVVLAAARGRRVRLGVRQDLPRYTRLRHPDRRVMHIAADVLETAFRLLARRYPVVVVGPDLAANYHRAPRLLTMSVSLVRRADVLDPDGATPWPARGPRTILSVGRLDPEKNPLLLADVLAALLREEPGGWRLVVAGDGPLSGELAARLRELGVAGDAQLLGYVPLDEGLGAVYRRADAFLHVSWTEGVPQVLFEAFAAALPVVATAVGGVAAAVGDAAVLVGPGDAEAAAAALRRLDAEPELGERLVRAGHERVLEHTLEAEAARVAAFLDQG